MRFTLLITSAPTSPVAQKALDFAGALLHQGNAINRLFFFSGGVEQTRHGQPLATGWEQLVSQHQLAVTVCSGSAAHHKVTQADTNFPIAGLGDWLMASLDSDRLITF